MLLSLEKGKIWEDFQVGSFEKFVQANLNLLLNNDFRGRI